MSAESAETKMGEKANTATAVDIVEPDEQAYYRRQAALAHAVALRPPGHVNSQEVLADAKLFDAFLRGE